MLSNIDRERDADRTFASSIATSSRPLRLVNVGVVVREWVVIGIFAALGIGADDAEMAFEDRAQARFRRHLLPENPS